MLPITQVRKLVFTLISTNEKVVMWATLQGAEKGECNTVILGCIMGKLGQ